MFAFTLTALGLAGALLTTAAAAPQKGKKPAPMKKPAAAEVAGKKVYDQNKCANCHAIGGKGGKAGPDLSGEGAIAGHNAAWLEAEIKNPKSHKPGGSMPAFADKIKGKDLSNLAAYMGSLKK